MSWLRKRRRIRRRNLKRITFRLAYPTLSSLATIIGLIGLIATLADAILR